MTEPDITINGTRLDTGQAMTVRVAIEHFASWLLTDGCGDDEHGKRMTAAYRARILQLRALYMSNARPTTAEQP